MENLRNTIDIRLVTNSKDFLELVPKPSFDSQKIFN